MKERSLRQVVKRLFLASLVRSSRMGKNALPVINSVKKGKFLTGVRREIISGHFIVGCLRQANYKF
jgi:hypothetical protein